MLKCAKFRVKLQTVARVLPQNWPGADDATLPRPIVSSRWDILQSTSPEPPTPTGYDTTLLVLDDGFVSATE